MVLRSIALASVAVLAAACGGRTPANGTAGFGFASAPGWRAFSAAGPGCPAGGAVASTGPIANAPDTFPQETIKRLSSGQILLWACASVPSANSASTFTPASLPLQLSDARVDPTWEGQPNADAPQYLLWRRANGYDLDVRAFFGSQKLSPDRLAQAQAELDRLQVPAAPQTKSTRPMPLIHWRQSVSLGRPDHGTLVHGVRFPRAGPHFFTWDPILHRRPDRPWRRYGNNRLVRIVLRVVNQYTAAHPEAPRVGIGDFSLPHGGYFGPKHASHQNGLDVDVYYPRLDRRERPPLRESQIDRPLAQDLLDRLVAAGAKRIFVGPNTHLTGPARIVRVLWNHDNHMHVRFAGP